MFKEKKKFSLKEKLFFHIKKRKKKKNGVRIMRCFIGNSDYST